ncbi:hypothetical protein Drose_12445 [Dactylosporangium roseum]|uniref:Uncharacterized protein n=1 Tax=Dactylosporangium roseum TaxID=47989 RepID=A0ABY5ZAR2_9ACTN|nr:hypothetical protein [Dactylosporangium roseum]UWZ38957.1 hypothetical protein Drose_12445 [Dactylosporangium roseum]
MIPLPDAGESTTPLPPVEAVAAVEAALRGGLDPTGGTARLRVVVFAWGWPTVESCQRSRFNGQNISPSTLTDEVAPCLSV